MKSWAVSTAVLTQVLMATGPAAAFAQTPAEAPAPSLHFSGDLRLRYEYTSEGNGAPALGKEVLRFRLGMTYPLRQDLVARARLSTGSAGDPNSTDITLGSFLDDLAVSLDVASVELTRKHWAVFGGKFLNPFLSTELVWDGDVNPQGLAGRLTGKHGALSATLTGMYFVIDAQPGDSGSDMAGGQLAVAATDKEWRLAASSAFYDFKLKSLVNTDAGDIRGNRLAPGGGRYLSDFDLLDAIVSVDYSGFGERFPARLIGEYVHNFGADGPNTGWGADLYVGRAQKPGDARFRYGYALAETDAILAAFAHDNTTLGTNSETHTLSADAIPTSGLLLNATFYVYRPHQVATGVRREYQKRLRLNAMVSF
jgi:hypothetical protein